MTPRYDILNVLLFHFGAFDVGRKRAVGVTGLLAALRKRSADVMQPAAKHEELLR